MKQAGARKNSVGDFAPAFAKPKGRRQITEVVADKLLEGKNNFVAPNPGQLGGNGIEGRKILLVADGRQITQAKIGDGQVLTPDIARAKESIEIDRRGKTYENNQKRKKETKTFLL